MVTGAVYAGLTMATPLVMALVGIGSYHMHHRRLQRRCCWRGILMSVGIWAVGGIKDTRE